MFVTQLPMACGGGVLSLDPIHLNKSLALNPPKNIFWPKMGKFGKKWHFLTNPQDFHKSVVLT
jgi:hypothetical protein